MAELVEHYCMDTSHLLQAERPAEARHGVLIRQYFDSRHAIEPKI